MNLWEELEACKFEDNEYLVDHLIEVVKDENINSLEELIKYENNYFVESGMSREDWVKWYENSIDKIPDLERLYGPLAANKIKELKAAIKNTNDLNTKIENIIKICVILEKECCFLVETYNLIVGGSVEEFSNDVIQDEMFEQGMINQIVEVPNEQVIVDPNKNVVLCGSIKFIDEMVKIRDRLKGLGFNVLMPEAMVNDKIIAFRNHFDKIANPDNGIVLVVNATKNGIPNYIGVSTFAEMAFGFYHNKKMFLLNDIFQPYSDELKGWNVVCLNGNLNNITKLI